MTNKLTNKEKALRFMCGVAFLLDINKLIPPYKQIGKWTIKKMTKREVKRFLEKAIDKIYNKINESDKKAL